MHEELERKSAAEDCVLPRSVVFASIAPFAPGGACSREAGLDVAAGRQDEGFLVGGADDEQAGAARSRRKAASDCAVARRRVAGSERADGGRLAAGPPHPPHAPAAAP